MQAQQIESVLQQIIRAIQEYSGLECPDLDGGTVPANDVPDFDSKVWIAATTLLVAETGIKIPNEENIFVDKDTKAPLTISQIAHLVCEIAGSKKSSGQAA